jgi:hypothetical protein
MRAAGHLEARHDNGSFCDSLTSDRGAVTVGIVMWGRERRKRLGAATRLAVVLATAGLLAGCFEPLYGRHASTGGQHRR